MKLSFILVIAFIIAFAFAAKRGEVEIAQPIAQKNIVAKEESSTESKSVEAKTLNCECVRDDGCVTSSNSKCSWSVSSNVITKCDFQSCDYNNNPNSLNAGKRASRDLQKKEEEDEEEDQQRERHGDNHSHYQHHDDHHHEHHQHDGPENLITNGGFEDNFRNWTRFGVDQDTEGFRIQTGRNFYSDVDLPVPPRGQQAAMLATADGKTISGLYQDFSTEQFSQCAIVKFDVSYLIFYRNDHTEFDNTFILKQYLRVNVYDPTNYANVYQTIFDSIPGTAQNTSNAYVEQKGTFFYMNGINDVPVENFRFQVLVRSDFNRLRVGIDRVRVNYKCVNFQ